MEARSMINAGLAVKMMKDYWCDHESDIYLVCPAEKGREGKTASFWPHGGCVLQIDGLCSIHDSGFKPYEARMVDHEDRASDSGIHREVANMWDGEEGRDVVELWSAVQLLHEEE
jgi:hypothetical protein